MHRCGSGFLLLILAIIFVTPITGCLGKSTSNSGSGGVQTVTLVPGGIQSIDVGGTLVFSATGRDAKNVAVLGVNIQFFVASGDPNAAAPLSVFNNGSGSAAACAGTWDSTATICSAGNPGIALVTAVINGVSSPPTTVYVHHHIDSIVIKSAETQPPQFDCFSQGQIWHFQAVAFSNNVDISNSIGPLTWTSTNFGVVTTTAYTPPNQPHVLNQIQAAAQSPGITQLFASVAGTVSEPYQYTTCLIQAIYLQIGGEGQAGNSITVHNGSSVPITAIAVDTLCGVANNTPLANPPLTWSTTDPEVADFSSITNSTGSNNATARNNLGGATLTASCTPPTCNIGLPLSTPSGTVPSLPIYASDYDATAPPTNCRPPITKGFAAISANVTSTSTVPNYTAWAATTGCHNASGCSSALFPVTPGVTPIGSIIGLPRTPNSMMFNHQTAARLYIGSDQGLMYVDVTTNPSVILVANSPTPCNVSLCGKVLTISNDGKSVVVSDTVSTPSQVYIYNGSTSPVDLILSNAGEVATAAAFSPDQLKLFILTNRGNLYIHSTLDSLTSVSTGAPATDVEFSADGSFAYVAGAPASSVSAFSTCSLPGVGSVDIGTVATSSTPLKIFPSPVVQAGPQLLTQNVIALEPPNVEILTAQFTQDPILYSDPLQLTCNPPVIPPGSFTKSQLYSLGQPNFIPVYSQLVGDGSELLVIARHLSAALMFDVSNRNTTSITLVGNTDPLSASASADGSQIYVAACDQYAQDGTTCAAGSVHIVNTGNKGDFQQVPYVNINDNNNPNMCNNQGGTAPLCLPDLIAIQPQ